ncbi:MAG: hypothetical protein A3I03_09965 [Candidatus Rokubacteria bacterium RIFCSPLOWO2_02_FULL_68_19]|nr:MAG: hypothetical protein A3I03_09965 [Candidatus Rokubacteria bacterium RIFCSPLOWO2_02_FULL_68_19]
MKGQEFVDLLAQHRYDFFAWVPCSLLEGVLSALATRPRLPSLPATREDAAVGCAAGAWLAGGRPAVLMQNSGLGTGLNALASLSLMYRLPCLLVVTWRGFRGEDAPEHLLMGDISPRLLEMAGIPHRALSAVSVEADLAWATRETFAREAPVALLVPPGVLESEHMRSNNRNWDRAATRRESAIPAGHGRADRPGARAQIDDVGSLKARISRYEALAVVIRCLADEPVIHANGHICRESCAVADRPQNFYMLGSMGLAASIGLGVALTRPGRKAVIFDGDGNLLMNLGSLAMAGGLRPKNFVHFVFDNEAYGSTGDQPSLSREVRLDRLATAAGYPWVRAVTDASALEATTREVLDADGPAFVLVKVTPESRAVPRIPYSPTDIRDRFRTALGAP